MVYRLAERDGEQLAGNQADPLRVHFRPTTVRGTRHTDSDRPQHARLQDYNGRTLGR